MSIVSYIEPSCLSYTYKVQPQSMKAVIIVKSFIRALNRTERKSNLSSNFLKRKGGGNQIGKMTVTQEPVSHSMDNIGGCFSN